MANKNLFQAIRGALLPATTAVNDAGAPAYTLSAEASLAQLAATGERICPTNSVVNSFSHKSIAVTPSVKYPCPCCGYQTHDSPVGGSMQICPVCFWEDAPGEPQWNGSNKVPLEKAQQNFRTFGACEDSYLDAVRPPSADEQRSADWLSLEDQAQAIIVLIENAFAGVQLGNGVTIHQREAIDDYASAEDIEAARREDTESRWQDIPDGKIARLGTSLVFLDPESIRYHLPAFMRYAVRSWLECLCYGAGDAVLYGLMEGPRSEGYHADSFLLLDEAQKRSVAAFLRFVTTIDAVYGSDAEKALAKGWAEFLQAGF